VIAPRACSIRSGARPSYISTGSSAGVFIVDGIPRRSVTWVAAGSAARCTPSGSGTFTKMVPSVRIRVVPLPSPSSVPSARNRGPSGSSSNRSAIWSSVSVPFERLWHVRHVRPLPPKVS